MVAHRRRARRRSRRSGPCTASCSPRSASRRSWSRWPGLIAWNGVVLLLIGSRGTVILQDDFIIDLANGFLSEGTRVDADARLRRALRGHAAERDPRAPQGGPRAGAVSCCRRCAIGGAGHRARRRRATSPTRTAGSRTWACSWRRCSCSGPSSSGARASAATCTPSAATPRRRAAPGINVDRIRIYVFAICSLMAAVGGIILASRLRSVDTNAGGGSILLYSIAAAVIGGTSLFGGRGHIKSALLGALVIASIDNGLGLLGLGSGREVRDHRRRAAARGHGRLRFAPPPGAGRDAYSCVIRHRGEQGRRAPRWPAASPTRAGAWRAPRAAATTSGSTARSGSTCDVRDPAQVDAAVAAAVARVRRPRTPSSRTPAWAAYGPFLELAARAGGGDDRREPQGHALHGARGAPAPDRVQGRLPLAGLGGGAARLPGRDRLQRLEVRPAGLHALARPRDARARACA